MDRNDEPNDPFAGLEDWARETEKRVRKQVRREPRPPRPRRAGARPLRNALLVVTVAAGAVALSAAVPALRSVLPLGSSRGAAGAYPTAAVPSGVTVTTSPSAAPTDPFAGTPAARYPKGAAGITLPAAAKVTGFSAAQVGQALQQVRAAMVAGRLDEQMLVDHRPDKFLALLAPGVRKDIQQWFATGRQGGVATWIDPAVRLDPAEPPRVSGRVTYAGSVDQGVPVLRVTTNFVWVYAFTGPRHPIAAEHDQVVWEFFSATAGVRSADRGMWIDQTKSYSAWVDCAAGRKGLFAPTRAADVTPQPSDSEDPKNYLRADHSLDIADDCGMAK